MNENYERVGKGKKFTTQKERAMKKKIDELEKNLQAERDKVALASSIFATLADLNTVLIKRT